MLATILCKDCNLGNVCNFTALGLSLTTFRNKGIFFYLQQSKFQDSLTSIFGQWQMSINIKYKNKDKYYSN